MTEGDASEGGYRRPAALLESAEAAAVLDLLLQQGPEGATTILETVLTSDAAQSPAGLASVVVLDALLHGTDLGLDAAPTPGSPDFARWRDAFVGHDLQHLREPAADAADLHIADAEPEHRGALRDLRQRLFRTY